MPKSKFYAMREMIYDRCLSSGREYTAGELMAIVNSELEARGMSAIRSRTSFMQDMNEMNEKLFTLYGHYDIRSERRNGNKVYYSYGNSNESLYDRALTDDEVARLQQVSTLLQALGYTAEMKNIFAQPKYSTMEELQQIRKNMNKKKAHKV